jgi:hypothetical protein
MLLIGVFGIAYLAKFHLNHWKKIGKNVITHQ